MWFCCAQERWGVEFLIDDHKKTKETDFLIIIIFFCCWLNCYILLLLLFGCKRKSILWPLSGNLIYFFEYLLWLSIGTWFYEFFGNFLHFLVFLSQFSGKKIHQNTEFEKKPRTFKFFFIIFLKHNSRKNIGNFNFILFFWITIARYTKKNLKQCSWQKEITPK